MSISFNLLWTILWSVAFFAFLVFLVIRLLKAGGLGEAGPERRDMPVSKGEVGAVFCCALLFRIVILLFALLFSLLHPSLMDNELAGALVRWDGQHYINLIQYGYTFAENGKHIFLVFFPMYVWVSRGVDFLIRNAVVSAALVSILCYCLGCCQLYRLTFREYGKAVAVKAVLLLSVFPYAFFFGGVMSESLFFLLTVSALYEIRRHRWFLAGAIGVFAALTRMTGALLIIPAICEMVEYYRPFEAVNEDTVFDNLKQIAKKLPAAFMPLLGTAGYLGLNYYIDKDPFAFLKHHEHWFQGSSWFSDTLYYIAQNIGRYMGNPLNIEIWIPEFILFFLFSALLVWAAFRGKHRCMYLMYGFAYLIMNYSLAWLLSAGRYLSCGVVFFIFLACILEKKPILTGAFAAVMGAFFIVNLCLHLLGAQIM